LSSSFAITIFGLGNDSSGIPKNLAKTALLAPVGTGVPISKTRPGPSPNGVETKEIMYPRVASILAFLGCIVWKRSQKGGSFFMRKHPSGPSSDEGKIHLQNSTSDDGQLMQAKLPVISYVYHQGNGCAVAP
jgi:hypothetical protein